MREVHTVNLLEEPDGLYVFEDEDLAIRFAEACRASGHSMVMQSTEPICDERTTEILVNDTLREDAGDMLTSDGLGA